jgi:uncharacterized surface protein with fasciclin (FAS1) repeats
MIGRAVAVACLLVAAFGQLLTSADTLLELITADERLSVLASLVGSSNAAEDLLDPRTLDLTLFAPSDEAFEKLDPEQLHYLEDPANDEKLMQLIELHIVVGNLEIGNLEDTEALKTVRGDYVAITGSGHIVNFGPSTVVDMDITARNGVLHIIDTVLAPEGLLPRGPLPAALSVDLSEVKQPSSDMLDDPGSTNLDSKSTGMAEETVPSVQNEKSADSLAIPEEVAAAIEALAKLDPAAADAAQEVLGAAATPAESPVAAIAEEAAATPGELQAAAEAAAALKAQEAATEAEIAAAAKKKVAAAAKVEVAAEVPAELTFPDEMAFASSGAAAVVVTAAPTPPVVATPTRLPSHAPSWRSHTVHPSTAPSHVSSFHAPRSPVPALHASGASGASGASSVLLVTCMVADVDSSGVVHGVVGSMEVGSISAGGGICRPSIVGEYASLDECIELCVVISPAPDPDDNSSQLAIICVVALLVVTAVCSIVLIPACCFSPSIWTRCLHACPCGKWWKRRGGGTWMLPLPNTPAVLQTASVPTAKWSVQASPPASPQRPDPVQPSNTTPSRSQHGRPSSSASASASASAAASAYANINWRTPNITESKATGAARGGRTTDSAASIMPTPVSMAPGNHTATKAEHRRRHAAKQLLAPIRSWRVSEEVIVATGDSTPKRVRARAWQQAKLLQEL